MLNEAGGYPTHNFKCGQFEGAPTISGETQAALEIAARRRGATHGCHRGCVIQCSGIYHDKDGHYLTKQPEYETVWAHGGNCGIDDLDAIAQLDRMDDDFGVDTIEMGATIGVAMEAGLTKFGDAEAAIRLVKKSARERRWAASSAAAPPSRARSSAWSGCRWSRTRRMPAYDPRAVQGIGVTYATTTHGRRPHRRLRRRHQHPEGRRRR